MSRAFLFFSLLFFSLLSAIAAVPHHTKEARWEFPVKRKGSHSPPTASLSLSFLLSHFLSLPLTLSSTHKQSDRSKFLFACVSQVNVEHSETLANIQPKKGFGRP